MLWVSSRISAEHAPSSVWDSFTPFWLSIKGFLCFPNQWECDKTSFLLCLQSSSDAIYIARHVGLRVGVPMSVPALTVNRLCGSGFQSIANGCQVQSCISVSAVAFVRPLTCRNMSFVFGRVFTWVFDRDFYCPAQFFAVQPPQCHIVWLVLRIQILWQFLV